jgi:serine/threonine protein kinase
MSALRDIKPEHILLAADGLRVADFSTAAYLPWKQAKLTQDAERNAAAATPPAAGGDGAAARPRRASAGQALRCELLNHRLSTMAVEYMAPEVLSKPTAAEVFHLVRAGRHRAGWVGGRRAACWLLWGQER